MLEVVVIAVAMEGLATGQCTARFTREPPTTVSQLFEIMNQYTKSDDDCRRRKVGRYRQKQVAKTPRPPQTPLQQNVRPFRSINNLQQGSGHFNPEQDFTSLSQYPPHCTFDHLSRGG